SVFGFDNLSLCHDVLVGPSGHSELDLVPGADALQSPEETVAVPSDAQVSYLPNFGGSSNSPNTAVQRELISVIKNRNFETDPRYAQNRKGLVLLLGQARFIRCNSTVVPEAKVHFCTQVRIDRGGQIFCRHAGFLSLESRDGCP